MAEITVYSTCWCCDCRRAKQFLRERKIPFREVNIDESPDAEEIVLNGGHVGIVVGRAARTALWPRVTDWLARHD